ncbi:MAG: molybdenum cofactor guanylyltransferase [Gallionella sp.]|nr:molybdenum cofactor guanylyltransferase [Gallionella sp.]
MIADCTALILAGGESRRMGQDKARVLLGEQTLLQRVSAIVQPLFAEVIVSVRQPRADCNFPQVSDDPAHAGPLAGLAAGLARSKTPWLFVVACDMPFVTRQLIENIDKFREGVDAVVPVVQGYPQPMAAFYATRCLGALREILDGSGRHSLRELLDRLNVRYVNEADLQETDLRSFFDLDTPEDLALAENTTDLRTGKPLTVESTEISAPAAASPCA